MDENETAVGILESSDTDMLSYSLSGVDAGLFNLDANTGALSFLVVADYESAGDGDGDNVYELVVTVDDGQGESNSVSSSSVQVFVNNVNESPVVEMTTTLTLRFDENEDGEITTITTVDPEGVTIVYSVDDSSNFRVANNGVLSLKPGGLDYESLSGRNNGSATIEVMVTASDGHNPNNILLSFMVTINDVDERPIVESTTTPTLVFDENNDGEITTITAVDPEGVTIVYSVDDSSNFRVANNGVLRLKAGGLDYESLSSGNNGTATLEVMLTASDGVAANDVSRSFMVTINDVNERPIVESTTTPTLRFDENIDVAITTITAVDPEGDTIAYSVDDSSNFRVDNQGVLRLKAGGLDYERMGESSGTATIEVIVTASDDHAPNNIFRTFRVTINDVNESPVVEMTTTPALLFDENIEAAITTITAVDPERNTIAYSVDDSSNFRVANNGVLRLKAGGLDYESLSGGNNGTATIEVKVTASDGTADDISLSFMVTINDVAEVPVFNSVSPFSIDENEVSGSNGLGILTADDPGGDTVTYSVNDAKFSIGESTGELYLKEAQNYETLGTDKYLTVTVTVSNSADETATVEVRVNINNVNEAPVITENFEVVENLGVGDLLVLSDEDSTFTQTKSGADASFFTASVSNGELSFAMTAKDYENAQDADGDNVYEFSVVVNFADSQANSNLNVKVTINDVDDDEVIAGIGFNREILSSWHDASVAESFVDVNNDPVSDGEKFRRWQDQSGNGNTLWQGDANNQAKYEDGVMRYELDGGTSYQYSNGAQATPSLGLTTFSVLKIKDIPSSDANFLFGSPDEYRYHGGRNGKIFSSNALMSEVRVDGEVRSVGGSNAAEWVENETQIIYTRSNTDARVKIKTLSKDRANNDRSIRGDISEVIVFKGELNSAEKVVINNYLGAKWDVDLVSDDYYDGDTRINGDYDNDVTGLVKLSYSEVLETREMGGLRLLNNEGDGAIADNGDAFFVGHNGESGLRRVWYGDFTDASGKTGGKVDFIFSVSEFGLTAGATYALSLYYQGGASEEVDSIAGSDEIVFNGVVSDGFVVFYLVAYIDNRPPIFKQFQFSVDENSTAVTDFSVYDDSSTGHSYVIGGTDASLFNLTSSGSLSFRSAPDFEAAGDADGDNVYEIIVTVDDGQSSNNINSASIEVVVNDVTNVNRDATTGADTLTALNTQEDIFVFDEASESVSGGTTTLNADSIAGFANGDKIDLSHFSISSSDVLLAQTSGITSFSGVTAKVYVHKSSSDSIVYVNTDSDDNVELKITVSGFDLGLDDFIL